MQSETIYFAPGAANWQTRPTLFDVPLVPPPAEVDEIYRVFWPVKTAR